MRAELLYPHPSDAASRSFLASEGPSRAIRRRAWGSQLGPYHVRSVPTLGALAPEAGALAPMSFANHFVSGNVSSMEITNRVIGTARNAPGPPSYHAHMMNDRVGNWLSRKLQPGADARLHVRLRGAAPGPVRGWISP